MPSGRYVRVDEPDIPLEHVENDPTHHDSASRGAASRSTPRASPPTTHMNAFAQFSARRDGMRRAPPSDTPRKIKLLKSYAPDWILTILLAAAFFALDKVDGYKRVFSLTDTSLLHPYAVHERVPNWALYVIAIASPFGLQIIINLITIRSWWDFHNSTLGLILSLSLTGAVTQFTKLTVGRPRPDVVSRCIPIEGSQDPHWGLSTYKICTQTDAYILKDGFRSFPSGHSSLSFAGLGFLSFYLAGKLHLFDERGHTGKAWLSLAPFSGAALVAISRTMDYRHHWQDVLVGSILGTVLSYFSYRQYYPPLGSPIAHRPYSPRVHRGDHAPLESMLPTSVRGDQRYDDEQQYGYGHVQLTNNGGRGAGAGRGGPVVDEGAMAGTVPRGGPKHMHNVWKEGEETTPRPSV